MHWASCVSLGLLMSRKLFQGLLALSFLSEGCWIHLSRTSKPGVRKVEGTKGTVGSANYGLCLFPRIMEFYGSYIKVKMKKRTIQYILEINEDQDKRSTLLSVHAGKGRDDATRMDMQFLITIKYWKYWDWLYERRGGKKWIGYRRGKRRKHCE